MTRESALIYRNQVEALRELPPDQFKASMLAILDYSLDGIEPNDIDPVARAMWLMTKPLTDKRNKNFANGKNNKQTFRTNPNGSEHEANMNRTGSEHEPNWERSESEPDPKGERRKEKGENDRTDTNVSVRSTEAVQRIVSAWNELESAGIKPIRDCKSGTKRYTSLVARMKEYSEEDVLTAIRNCRDSRFLRGYNAKGWVITFDWLIKPNNFPKVLEGNYADTKSGDHVRGQYDYYENDWTDLLRDQV